MLSQLYELYTHLREENVVFCFSGPATQEVLEGIGGALKRKLELERASVSVTQRIFSLYVELMHNVIHYSSECSPVHCGGNGVMRSGVVVVGNDEGRFFVICGNRASLERSRTIQRRLTSLQEMDREELKEHYRTMRRQESAPDSKGACLGLIEMVKRSREPVRCHVAPLGGDMAFLSIEASG